MGIFGVNRQLANTSDYLFVMGEEEHAPTPNPPSPREPAPKRYPDLPKPTEPDFRKGIKPIEKRG